MRIQPTLFFTIFIVCSIELQAQKRPAKIDTAAAFDAYVQQAVIDWQVPGLAIVVVKNNQVAFKKTYGVRNLKTGQPVDNQTLFICASTTKAMTAACLGILVDQGKINWDDPVTKYMPDFALYDPAVTREIRVRDLFLHNTGVGNTDYLWVNNTLSSAEIVQKLQLVKPAYSLRSSFIYQNIFYLVAGQVIEKVSGMPWSEFITKKIFQPLGMNRTKALLSMVQDDNITSPHDWIDNQIQPIEQESADLVGPAGSVLSSIDDIARWVSCMLDSSKYSGGRLLSTATWKELLKPQVLVPEAQFYPTQQLTKPNFTSYAFGWFQQDYKGHKLNFHTGSLSGVVALHGQMPDLQTGVYIFANLDHAEIRHALMFKALDLFALGGNRDWNKEFLQLYTQLKNQRQQKMQADAAKRVMNTTPALPLSAYTGKYVNPLYGDFEITLTNNQLVARLNNKASGVLLHWNYDSFQLNWDKKWEGKEMLSFNLNTNGKVQEMVMGSFTFKKETK